MATTATTQTNKQFSLNYRDLLRGLLIAVITAVITAVYESIQQGGLDKIEWKEVLAIAITAGLSYLVKNYFTPTEIVVVNPPKEAVSAVSEGANVRVGSTSIPNNNAATLNVQ